jgi:hypothetical protein
MANLFSNPISHEEEIRTTSQSRFAPASVVSGAVGLLLLLLGLIAIVRCGVRGAISEPVVELFGFNHTAVLGFIEVGLGLCLLMTAASAWRGGEIFLGAVLGVGGFVGAVQADSFESSLALEASMSWLAVIAGILIVTASSLLPRYGTHSTSVTHR